ncbi:MAG: phenylalanine--tRNA ligase subunit beta [Chromatiales bacterium]|nr:MAG: phenylalanine--tRNA ligase subunit beta [Chromatiales bacterium]
MKISDKWLREWLDTELDAAAIADRLTGLGLEVDSVESLGNGLDDVVVGRVLEVAPHPNAERLSLCRVDAGGAAPLQIVCGAPNVEAERNYPVALVGARLPGGQEIRRAEIRAVLSEGMLCSATELGLADEADGLLALADEDRPGTPVTAALGLDDVIIDVDLTPNRADCFSMLGVARDLSAGLQTEIKVPRVLPVLPVIDETFPIDVTAPEGCPRFAGRVIRDLDPGAESPAWLKARLRGAGVRPIHPIVDVTNYVMLELGQPMHAYNLERLRGRVDARFARAGENLALLDGRTIELDEDLLVIADDAGPVGLAGIMGGVGSAVDSDTRHVFLEAAFFSPAIVAGRARRLGMHTDASLRFERGVDPAHQGRAVERATALLLEIAGGRPGPLQEVANETYLPAHRPVPLRRARLAQVLGVKIPDDAATGILNRLDMRVESTEVGWAVTAPPSRFDIALEVDLIEEVARVYGYDQVPEQTGPAPGELPLVTEFAVTLDRAREVLVDAGYQEVVTWSFVDADLDRRFAGGRDGLALANPIASHLAVMRQSLWPGLCQAAAYNLARQQERVLFFESGVRFIQQNNELVEETMIAGLAVGSRVPEQWGEPAENLDLFDIKSVIEAFAELTGEPESFDFRAAEHAALRPGRSAEVLRQGRCIGHFGELHPTFAKRLDLPSAPLVFELLAEPLLAAVPPRYRPVSRFPAVRRDLAVVVGDDVPAGELLTAIRSEVGTRLADLRVFDVYTGEKVETGSKSVALGLILQDTSRTLTDADVEGIMHGVVGCLAREFNAAIRE